MPARKPVLGRGLDALLSPSRDQAEGPVAVSDAVESPLRQVEIDEIRPNPFQPRNFFDPEKIEELAESIREHGILQPILLRETGAGFEIVAGERRWRAARKAGLTEVPAIVQEFDDRRMLQAAVIENVQRDDLNPIEESRSYQRLVDQFGMTQDALAQTVGKSRVYITNSLRLLKLAEEVLMMIENDDLSAGHGRALLGLDSPEAQANLARDAAKKGLSVREVERRVRKINENSRSMTPPQAPGAPEADVAELQGQLCEALGLKVRLAPRSRSAGKIEVFYSSLDEFQGLCQRLGLNPDQSL